MNPILTMALRRAKPGTGSSNEFLDRRTATQPVPDLSAILGTIPWVLVGGIAIRAYMPERTTLDVDIMIRESEEARARAAFIKAGYATPIPYVIEDGGGAKSRPRRCAADATRYSTIRTIVNSSINCSLCARNGRRL